jgi:hypothetical protein
VPTGCRFEKRVYLSKPSLNLLKTWFLRENELKTFARLKVWTKVVNRFGLKQPKT